MSDPGLTLFTETASRWGLPLQAEQLAAFASYADELVLWNERVNLTAITRREEIYLRHFLDSLSCARFWGAIPHHVIDIGSGAGFPGLPLKIVFPHIQLTLLESVSKKAVFLDHMVATLGLQGVQVLPLRAEEAGRVPTLRGQADLVTARAVAELRVLLEYAMPLLRVGGQLLAPKGAAAAEEQQAASRALAILGAEITAVEPVDLPGLDERRIVVVRKITPTNERYPRSAGVPSRRPL
jgi:16S rRNA (guanine527-N7)-methyltransferase